MVKVKICGITNVDDAKAAVDYGADAIGMVIDVPFEAPRKISIERAAEILKVIPPFVSSVALAMPCSMENFRGILEKIIVLNFSVIQLQGSESVELVESLKEAIENAGCGTKIIKVFHIDAGSCNSPGKFSPEDIAEGIVRDIDNYSGFIDAASLDTKIKGAFGGTGFTHDRDIDRYVREHIRLPLIVAGGLTPDNVGDVIRHVRPYGVDVSSGIEGKIKGKKDHDKLRRFIEISRRA